MKSRSIEIVVQPSGELSIDAVGFQGADCEQATVFLEQTLGAVTDKRRTPDYFRRARRHQSQQLGV